MMRDGYLTIFSGVPEPHMTGFLPDYDPAFLFFGNGIPGLFLPEQIKKGTKSTPTQISVPFPVFY